MLAEAKKQLNQNLRSLHLPTIRHCHEEQARLAEKNSSSYEHYLHEVVELEVDPRQGARIGSFDTYENRSCHWKRVGKRLSASDCPGSSTCSSTLCSKARSSTGTRTSSRSAIQVAGRHTCCVPSHKNSSIEGIEFSLRRAVFWFRSCWWRNASYVLRVC